APAVLLPKLILPPLDQVVNPGTNVTFSVKAAGAEPLSYQWRFRDQNLAGATNATLVLTNVGSADVGDYSVVVANGLGSATSGSANLNLVGGAQIAREPADQSVSLGANVTFSVTASGTPPFTYLWRL